jgi:hypothetical protein
VRELGLHRRGIVIDGTLASDRFTVREQPPMTRVLWMDRKLRFVLTIQGLWKLGARERDVDMNFIAPVEEKADE